MSETIRPELCKHHRYWISRHKYYELKHFCMQYYEWQKEYRVLSEANYSIGIHSILEKGSDIPNPTEQIAIRKAELANKMKVVRDVCHEADPELEEYLFMGVTKGCSFNFLQTKEGMPAGKDLYYDRLRKLYWILSKQR